MVNEFSCALFMSQSIPGMHEKLEIRLVNNLIYLITINKTYIYIYIYRFTNMIRNINKVATLALKCIRMLAKAHRRFATVKVVVISLENGLESFSRLEVLVFPSFLIKRTQL